MSNKIASCLLCTWKKERLNVSLKRQKHNVAYRLQASFLWPLRDIYWIQICILLSKIQLSIRLFVSFKFSLLSKVGSAKQFSHVTEFLWYMACIIKKSHPQESIEFGSQFAYLHHPFPRTRAALVVILIHCIAGMKEELFWNRKLLYSYQTGKLNTIFPNIQCGKNQKEGTGLGWKWEHSKKWNFFLFTPRIINWCFPLHSSADWIALNENYTDFSGLSVVRGPSSEHPRTLS